MLEELDVDVHQEIVAQVKVNESPIVLENVAIERYQLVALQVQVDQDRKRLQVFSVNPPKVRVWPADGLDVWEKAHNPTRDPLEVLTFELNCLDVLIGVLTFMTSPDVGESQRISSDCGQRTALVEKADRVVRLEAVDATECHSFRKRRGNEKTQSCVQPPERKRSGQLIGAQTR